MSSTAQSSSERITCIKCKSSSSNIKIRQANFCKACFLINFITKFKSNLSKTSTPLEDERAQFMVAFSGGPSSRALLELACRFQTPSETGKLHQKYTDLQIAHIDETALFPDINEPAIISIIETYSFKSNTNKLEDIFSIDEYSNYFQTTDLSSSSNCILSHINPDIQSSPKNLLINLFKNIKSVTSREYMLTHIKNYLILKLAKSAGCQIAVVGDSSTKIAFNSILGISQGRGFSMPFDVSGESQLDPQVYVLRPLKSSLSKEIAYYNHIMGLKSVSSLTFTTKAIGSNVSLAHTTEAFMNTLDLGYSATIPTVTSTVSKLKISSEILNNKDLNICIVCSTHVSTLSRSWRSNFSLDSLDTNNKIVESDTVPKTDSDSNQVNVSEMLCYACTTLMNDINPGTVLPGFFFSKYELNNLKN
ncbi:hypothetical protein BB561_003803 [Smittium simulii]|uniref:Cytoplasmic tRNA 2-thiolation protein 2 n=1 Tax=Smittium simulii TaxID=133385 RepID=A0A2T9YJH9_9FUNG|nr:hypothetical protein BB561_003803 [Smittium simulii]